MTKFIIQDFQELRKCPRYIRISGFTLVEIVAVILISSIMAAGIVGYMGRAVEGIESAENLNQLASSGQVAINRISFELHNSLPMIAFARTPSGASSRAIALVNPRIPALAAE